MRSDEHEVFRHMIDESLALGTTLHQNESLREHLQSCTSCNEYFSANTKVIAGLSGFSFEADGALQVRVCESVRLRAQQINATQPSRRRLALITLLAVVLTAAGSFTDLQFGGLIASMLDLQRDQMRQELLTFWIVPSLCLLLLFPLLPLLSKGKERVL